MDVNNGQFTDPTASTTAQMRRQRRMAGGRLVGAFVLIGLGVAFFLDNIGILRFQDIWRFWPLYLLAVGIAKASGARCAQDRSWGVIMIVVGAIFLAWNFGALRFLPGNPFNWIIGLVLVAVGVQMLIGPFHPGHRGLGWGWGYRSRGVPADPPTAVQDGDALISSLAVFGSTTKRVERSAFRGADAQAIFGEVKIDLRLATIEPGVTPIINVQVVFGAVKIRVPYNWRISMQTQGVFGAAEDKTVPDPRAAEIGPLLIIAGSHVFGAVEIEN